MLLLQGNTGTGANWLRPTLADELFKPGQPLDAGQYFIIMPDALGRGGSSKPSDGLKGKFPHYRYHDMVDCDAPAGHRRAQGRASASGDRQFARLHAAIHVGRDVSRPDGRDGRAVLPAGRDQRPQLSDAPRRGRGDPPRPGLEQRRLREEPDAITSTAAAGSVHAPKARCASRKWRRPATAAKALYDKRVARGRQGRRQQHAVGNRVDRGLQPRGRSAQDQGQGAADQHGRGRRQPARTRHRRARR